MTTDCVYREALLSDDAIAEIQRCSGTQFDPDIVAAFLARMSKIVIPSDVSMEEMFKEAMFGGSPPKPS